jgi:GT2 family glycosyltransferase
MSLQKSGQEEGTDPKVSVVVPVYNRRDLTISFLRNFEHVTYQNCEIVIVDDGSTDGTSEVIAREFPHVRLLRESGDLWWTKATNIGVRDALAHGANYILTINDDVDVDPNFLSALVTYARSHPLTLIGSFIYDLSHPSHLWYAGGKIGWVRGDLIHRSSLRDGTLAWLTGMGTLIPAEVFRRVGFYDEENFPQYTADADLSMRARKDGFSLAVEPSSVIWNKTEESAHVVQRRIVTWRTFFAPLFTMKSAYYLKMRVALYKRHWPPVLFPVALAAFFLRFIRKQMTRLLKIR